ncbi:NADH-cytochrome b5 reductase [Malassezia pachydermatis]
MYVYVSSLLTCSYRFEIPGTLGISTGQHVSVRAPVNGRQVMRSYTPITDHDVEGYVDLMVKSYPTGNLSRVMNELKIGDTVEMKGPKGRFLYEPNMVSRIGMIAGGTGITPCYQVIKAVLQNPADNTKLNLIYANVNEDEILLKKELDALAKQHPTRFSVYYFLDKPPANWTGGTGFVTREAIAEQLPSPSESCRILMCGPPPMMEAMKKHLVSLDFPPARTISKAEDIVFVF